MILTRISAGLLLAGVVSLGGCDGGAGSAPGATGAAPDRAELPSLSPELQATWDQSCGNCHSRAVSGAPLAGDTEAWAPRVAQGMDTLLEHTIHGYKGMPPLGLCMTCGEEDFRALIAWMSGMSES